MVKGAERALAKSISATLSKNNETSIGSNTGPRFSRI